MGGGISISRSLGPRSRLRLEDAREEATRAGLRRRRRRGEKSRRDRKEACSRATIETGAGAENDSASSRSNFDGTLTDRPDQVGNPYLAKRSKSQQIIEDFNTAAYAQVPAGTETGLGNVRYNALLSPGSIDNNLSAFKSFPVAEKMNLQFRA